MVGIIDIRHKGHVTVQFDNAFYHTMQGEHSPTLQVVTEKCPGQHDTRANFLAPDYGHRDIVLEQGQRVLELGFVTQVGKDFTCYLPLVQMTGLND